MGKKRSPLLKGLLFFPIGITLSYFAIFSTYLTHSATESDVTS